MKLLASLLSVALLAAPGAAASSRLASSASGRELASESTYAANNPVRLTDRDGMYPDGMLSREERADIQSHPEMAAIPAIGGAAVFTSGLGGVGAVVLGALEASGASAAVPAAAAAGTLGTGIGLALADQGGPPVARAIDAAGDAAKSVTLYRAVGEAELKSIEKLGKFSVGPNSMEGKWFAETADDAAKWGKAFGEKFSVLSAEIKKTIADKFFRVGKLDNIGPARYGEIDQLEGAVIKKVEEKK